MIGLVQINSSNGNNNNGTSKENWIAFQVSKYTQEIQLLADKLLDSQDQEKLVDLLSVYFSFACSHIDPSWSVQWRSTWMQDARYASGARSDGAGSGMREIGQVVDVGLGSADVTSSVLPERVQQHRLASRLHEIAILGATQLWGAPDPPLSASEPLVGPERGPTARLEMMSNVPEYRHTAEAILHSCNEHQVSKRELEKRFYGLSMCLGRHLSGEWRNRLRNSLRKSGARLVEDLYYEKGVHRAATMAMMFYGEEISKQLRNWPAVVDDMDAEPDLILSIARQSAVDHGLTTDSLEGLDVGCKLHGTAQESTKAWNHIFGTRPGEPIPLDPNDVYPDFDGRTVYSFSYCIVRSSNAHVFKKNKGSQAKADKELYRLLQHLQDKYRLGGERKRLVVFMVRCLDGWFTDRADFEMLYLQFPDVDMRMTILLSLNRDARPPRAFRERIPGVARGHFNMHTVREISYAEYQDADAPIKWQRSDQWSLLLRMAYMQARDVAERHSTELEHNPIQGQEISGVQYRGHHPTVPPKRRWRGTSRGTP